MIINSSHIEIGVEHEKSEFREITRSLDDRGLGSQFVAQLEALIARSQVKGAGDFIAGDIVNRLPLGSGR